MYLRRQYLLIMLCLINIFGILGHIELKTTTAHRRAQTFGSGGAH